METTTNIESRKKQALTVLITLALGGVLFVGLIAAVFIFFVRPNQ